MSFLLNRDINRLAAHTTLHALAWSFCGLFYNALVLLFALPMVPVQMRLLLASYERTKQAERARPVRERAQISVVG